MPLFNGKRVKCISACFGCHGQRENGNQTEDNLTVGDEDMEE